MKVHYCLLDPADVHVAGDPLHRTLNIASNVARLLDLDQQLLPGFPYEKIGLKPDLRTQWCFCHDVRTWHRCRKKPRDGANELGLPKPWLRLVDGFSPSGGELLKQFNGSRQKGTDALSRGMHPGCHARRLER